MSATLIVARKNVTTSTGQEPLARDRPRQAVGAERPAHLQERAGEQRRVLAVSHPREHRRDPVGQRVQDQQVHEVHDPQQQRDGAAALAEQVHERRRRTAPSRSRRTRWTAPTRIDGSSFFSQCAEPIEPPAAGRPGTAATRAGPQYIATAITSGTAPPTKNTERQPKSGISHSATKPPTAAPAVKPDGDAHRQRDAAALRAVLADERRGVRDDAAEAEARDEPQPEQLLDALREAGGERQDAKTRASRR